jgi:cell wall-associated NlpC family hydrolase
MGSALAVNEFVDVRDTRYALLAGGGAHNRGASARGRGLESDYVAVAETLIRTPYLWGGSSAFGIDCSGLVQLSMRMTGRDVLRDSDMQAGHLGEPLDLASDQLRRGDLVFWKGHVAIMTNKHTIIHASGYTMDVALEPLDVSRSSASPGSMANRPAIAGRSRSVSRLAVHQIVKRLAPIKRIHLRAWQARDEPDRMRQPHAA